MNEISIILICYAMNKSTPGRLIQVIADWGKKWQALASFQGAVYQIMQLQKLVNMFGGDLSRRYGQKVHKLTLHGGFSCPNRDGTIGRGGCTFCNVASFADEQAQVLPIQQQLRQRASESNRASRYLAYFQAYTSTYAEVDYLRQMYEEALGVADIVGLCVGSFLNCWAWRIGDDYRSSDDGEDQG